MISKCKCEHKAQDKLHGEGNRVFTPTTKKQGDKTIVRCTVCHSTKNKELTNE